MNRLCFKSVAIGLIRTSSLRTAPVAKIFHKISPTSFFSTSVNQHQDYFSVNESDNKLQFGDFDVIASQSQTHRQFVDAKTLGCDNGPKNGELVWLRGRVASVRGKGNACFIVIRSDTFYTVQACHFKNKETPEDSKSLIKYVTSLPCESIVDILGVVSAADVKSCTQNKVELQIKKIFAVSRAPTMLPFSLDDAGRSQAVIEASQEQDSSFVGVSQVG
jgi:aspartyl-tRNA synthetase